MIGLCSASSPASLRTALIGSLRSPATDRSRNTPPLRHIGAGTGELTSRIGEEGARKLADHPDTGSAESAVSHPQMALPGRSTGTRFMHVHFSAPSVMGNVKRVYAKRGVNIAGHYHQMDGEIGHVVVDAGGMHDSEATIAALHALPLIIRIRRLCEHD